MNMDMRTIIDYYLHAPLTKARQVHSVGALIIEERTTTTHSGPRLRSPQAAAPAPSEVSGSRDPAAAGPLREDLARVHTLTAGLADAQGSVPRETRKRGRRKQRPAFTEEAPPAQKPPALLPDPEPAESYGE